LPLGILPLGRLPICRYTVAMDQTPALRDALRIFRLLLIAKLLFLGLTSLAVVGMRGSVGPGLLLRAAPTLLLALLFLPPWLERPLGRYFLGVGLGLDVFFSSLEAAMLSAGWPVSRLAQAGVLPEIVELLAEAPPVEPFFFLIIPLVLLAWGYGRRGALLGSTWAAVLQLYLGLWIYPPDGYLGAFLAQSVMRIALLYLVPLLVSVLADRQRRQHRKLVAAHQRLRRHTATVEQLAVSRERNRLASELHDTLAHSLSALAVQLEALRTLLAHDPAAVQEAVGEISELARRGLEESRQAIQALRTGPVQALGLSGALRDRLQALQERTGVQIDFSVAGQARDLTTEEVDALFRIAEEALTNVERHPGARRVRVRLEYAADQTELTIQDDGWGFDPAIVDPDHTGLAGMQERAAMVGATITASGSPGRGTEIWCSLPR
jgi:signal transduction histidine kinase